MLFDDLETDPRELDEADMAAEAFFNTPEGMRQQIASLQQYNGLLIAQHERMEALLDEYKFTLPSQFIRLAREIGFYEPVSF